jgi:hypothetical protein
MRTVQSRSRDHGLINKERLLIRMKFTGSFVNKRCCPAGKVFSPYRTGFSTLYFSYLYIFYSVRLALWRLNCTHLDTRGQIFECNWEKSLKSLPPCYIQSPLLTDFTPYEIMPRNFNEFVCS